MTLCYQGSRCSWQVSYLFLCPLCYSAPRCPSVYGVVPRIPSAVWEMKFFSWCLRCSTSCILQHLSPLSEATSLFVHSGKVWVYPFPQQFSLLRPSWHDRWWFHSRETASCRRVSLLCCMNAIAYSHKRQVSSFLCHLTEPGWALQTDSWIAEKSAECWILSGIWRLSPYFV